MTGAVFLQGLAAAQGVDDINEQNAIVEAALAASDDPTQIALQVRDAALEAGSEPEE